jgi:hypothetical protein
VRLLKFSCPTFTESLYRKLVRDQCCRVNGRGVGGASQLYGDDHLASASAEVEAVSACDSSSSSSSSPSSDCA